MEGRSMTTLTPDSLRSGPVLIEAQAVLRVPWQRVLQARARLCGGGGVEFHPPLGPGYGGGTGEYWGWSHSQREGALSRAEWGGGTRRGAGGALEKPGFVNIHNVPNSLRAMVNLRDAVDYVRK